MTRLKLQEGETVEFKDRWADTALEALAALANHKGGTVYVGVDDDAQVVGWAGDDAEQQRIANQIVQALGLRPAITVEHHGRKAVLCLRVEPSSVPTAFRGRYLTRVGSTNRDMTPDQVGRRLMSKLGETWDALPADVPFSSLDLDAYRRFVRLAAKRLPKLSERDDPQEVLTNLRLIRNGTLTKAAVMLFGKHPAHVATSGQVHIGHFKAGVTLDDRLIMGNLWQQLDGVLDAFRAYLPLRSEVKSTAFTVEGIQRRESWEYPLDALREATINALIHRDYSALGDVQIRVEEDRIDFWNPGPLPEGITLADLLKERHPSQPRNPLMARAFFFAELIEGWGTGTTRMRELCREQSLPEPRFAEESGGFRVAFLKDVLTPELLRRAGLSERQVEAIRQLRQRGGDIRNSDYQQVAQVSKRTASRDLDELANRGVLLRLGETGRGTRYRLKGSETGQTGHKGAKNGPN